MAKSSRNHSYQHKLSLVFTGLSLLIALVAVAAALLAERNITESANHTLESLEEVSMSALSASLSEISRTVDYFSTSSDVLSWLDSAHGSADYYYNALRVYKDLCRWAPSTNSNTYNLAITRDEEKSFVITTNGTLSKCGFLSSIGGLEELPESQGAVLTEDGGMIVLTLERFLNDSTLIFYCILPASIFAPPQDSRISFALIDSTSHTVYSSDANLAACLENTFLPSGHSQLNSYYVRSGSFPYFSFTFVLAHASRLASPSILILAAFVTLSLAAVFFAAYRLKRNLYEPVKQAYESVAGTEASQELPEGNEFDMIISRCREAEEIGKRLEDLSRDLQAAMDVQKYRSYIHGADSMHRIPDDETSFFTVAILDADGAGAEKRQTLLLRTNSMTRRINHLHFIMMDNGSATLIYKSQNEEECHAFLYKMLREFTLQDEDAGMQAAISHTVQGWRNIKAAYLKAQSIMDSRYFERDRNILTEADVRLRSGCMYYPVSEERKLVNAALAASPSALEIFDSIIDANFSGEMKLTESEVRNLITALTSTIVRIRQEMRLPEESIPGDTGAQQSIQAARNLLSSTIALKSAESQEKGDQVARKMRNYIHEHYSEPIMLIDLSEEFNLTPKYCSEVFNRFSGDNFKNYLNRYRINMAQKILTEDPDVRIAELASRVGFSSSNTFIRVFDRYMGVTPKQYADSVREKN